MVIEMKKGDYVKVYDLCTGEITISIISFVEKRDKKIECWSGINEFRYEGEEEKRIIKPYTAIWDKRNMRWVFSLPRDYACFSSVIVDNCNWIERLLISGEKVTYDFDNDLYF